MTVKEKTAAQWMAEIEQEKKRHEKAIEKIDRDYRLSLVLLALIVWAPELVAIGRMMLAAAILTFPWK